MVGAGVTTGALVTGFVTGVTGDGAAGSVVGDSAGPFVVGDSAGAVVADGSAGAVVAGDSAGAVPPDAVGAAVTGEVAGVVVVPESARAATTEKPPVSTRPPASVARLNRRTLRKLWSRPCRASSGMRSSQHDTGEPLLGARLESAENLPSRPCAPQLASVACTAPVAALGAMPSSSRRVSHSSV